MNEDPFDLARFLEAQEGVYPRALAELCAGAKQTHWMWFVFPQLRRLGTSAMSRRYGITGRGEAAAYLGHAVLGQRLIEATEAMLALPDGTDATAVLGAIDAAKFRSSVTLFEAAGGCTPFGRALERYAAGSRCRRTLELVADQSKLGR
ncbi:MAG: DUF1810 domain-containing protein [Pseudomonadota bacterium]